MTSTPSAGKVLPLPKKGSGTPPLSIAMVVADLMNAAGEWVRVREEEATKRVNIEARRDVRLAEIHETSRWIMSYLEKTHDERERTFGSLLRQLDTSMANQDTEATALILGAISSLAQQSPFADIADAAAVMRKMTNPDEIWVV